MDRQYLMQRDETAVVDAVYGLDFDGRHMSRLLAAPDSGQAVNFTTRLRPCSLATYMARSARAWMVSMLRPSSG